MKIVILGSSGAIGRKTVALALNDPSLEVVGLAVFSNAESLLQDATALGTKHICVVDEMVAERVARDLPCGMILHRGAVGLCELASLDADMLVCAVVGMAGLRPVAAALESGKNIALATKEVLVVAGEAVMQLRRAKGVRITPIDSEHSAIFQALQSRLYSPDCTRTPNDGLIPASNVIRRLIVTASGGPFYFRDDIDFDTVSIEDALNHPKWKMGKKITIDSATMMNKGLEIIEARWLFDVPPGKIEVLVHPESIVHSIVEYCDLSQMAQLSIPDMTLAINYALSWPRRKPLPDLKPLDLPEVGALHFYKPNATRFSCLALAREALERGGNATAVLNAANEVAVDEFLKHRIRFSDIPRIVENTLGAIAWSKYCGIDEAIAIDAEARVKAREFSKSL